jgi:hypothetical protein
VADVKSGSAPGMSHSRAGRSRYSLSRRRGQRPSQPSIVGAAGGQQGLSVEDSDRLAAAGRQRYSLSRRQGQRPPQPGLAGVAGGSVDQPPGRDSMRSRQPGLEQSGERRERETFRERAGRGSSFPGFSRDRSRSSRRSPTLLPGSSSPAAGNGNLSRRTEVPPGAQGRVD